MEPREAGGRAAWAAFWKGTRPWPEGPNDGASREFWCEIAAKASEAIAMACGEGGKRGRGIATGILMAVAPARSRTPEWPWQRQRARSIN
jgi:hypothetical protein